MTEEHSQRHHAPLPPSQPGPSGAAAPARFAAVLALILAVLSAAAVAFLWWQYREFYVSLHDENVRMEASLERLRASQRASTDRIEALERASAASRAEAARIADGLDALPTRLGDLERTVEGLPLRVADLDRRLAAVQGGELDAKSTWLRAEAEYYLAAASAELELADRWDNAITALELADGRLRELADPALTPVRRQIAADLLTLRSVERPDLERIVLDLAALGARTEELPLRAVALPADAETPGLDAAEPGFKRLAESAKRALGSLIRVERRDDAEARAVSADRRAVARRELAAELAVARAAALRGRQAAYAASLEAAAQLLERDFDRTDPSVRAASELVVSLAAVDVAPQKPDIGRALSMLRGLDRGGA